MTNAYEIIGAAGRARAASAAADALCGRMPDDPTSEQINEYKRLNKESIRYRDEVINNPAFKLMPPLFQFRNKLWRAKIIRKNAEVSRARGIFVNELIHANKNLDKTAEGFGFIYETFDDKDSRRSEKIINGQMPYLYDMIMRTYQFEGRYDEAINAYMPYFKLDPDDEYALRTLSELRDPKLRKIPRHVKCMGGKSMIK